MFRALGYFCAHTDLSVTEARHNIGFYQWMGKKLLLNRRDRETDPEL